MPDMPPDQIAAARARADAATPGPWTLNDRALAPVRWPDDCHHLMDVAIAYRNIDVDDRDYDEQTNSLVFCAAARTDVPLLCDALLAAMGERDRLREACERAVACADGDEDGNGACDNCVSFIRAALREIGGE